MMMGALTCRGIEYWPLVLCALGLVLAATAFLYGPQMRRLGGAGRWALPALRLAALLALTASILRPVIIRDRSAEEQGQVLLLVDRSMSMGVLDRSLARPGDRRAVVGQLVAMADALGALPEGVRPRTLTGLYDIQRLEMLADEIGRTWREAEFARLSGRAPQEATARFDRAVAEFLDVARKAEQSVKAAAPRSALDHLANLARPPRGDTRKKWVEGLRAAVAAAARDAQRSQDALDEQLYGTDPRVRKQCDALAASSRLELAWQLLAGGKWPLLARLAPAPVAALSLGEKAARLPPEFGRMSLRDLGISANAANSDLIGGIASAIRQTGGQNVQAVVLVSDGRQVGGAHRSLPTGLLPPGVPVFAVYAASPSMRDIAIDRVDLPEAVFVNEPVPVRVSVRTLNIDPLTVRGNASISVRDSLPTTRPFQLKDRRTIQMPPVRLPEPGLDRLVVKLAAQQGEADIENNQVERWVKVQAQRLHVLLVGGSSNWEYRFIRGALRRTLWVQLRDALVSRSSPLNMGRDEVLQQDLVILNDVARDSLTAEQWSAVVELVRGRGGSLIIIPGTSYPQQQFSGHALAGLLPYSPGAARPAWRTWLGQDPSFHLMPHAAATNLPLLNEADGEGESRWDELPGFYRYLELPDLKPTARPLLVERETGGVVLTEEHVGSGRVFFFGMNETWRWRQSAGADDHDRFWQQMVRFAADEPYTLAQGPVFFDANPLVSESGKQIQLRARVLPRSGGSLPEKLNVLLMKDGEILDSRELPGVGEAGAGRYRGTLDALGVGDYDLKLIAPSDEGESIVLGLPLKIQPNPLAELADVSGDRDFLQRLADATGGKCLNLEQVPALPAMLQEARRRHPQTIELRLWDSGYLFLFVLACLSAEWALRKRFGLA